jgi:hypothetical protein
MEPRHHPPLIHGSAPDPSDYLWLGVSLPDGLYALPPDDPARGGDTEAASGAEALLLVGLVVAFGLLIAALVLAVVVA